MPDPNKSAVPGCLSDLKKWPVPWSKWAFRGRSSTLQLPVRRRPHVSWTPPATAFVVWFSSKLWAPQFRKQPDKQPALSVQGEKSCSFQVDLVWRPAICFHGKTPALLASMRVPWLMPPDSCISKKESVDLKRVPFDSQRYTFWVRTAQPKESLSWWPLWNHWLQNNILFRDFGSRPTKAGETPPPADFSETLEPLSK